jgi:hypothetical protein
MAMQTAFFVLLLLALGCESAEPPEAPARPSAFIEAETLKAMPYVAAVEVWSIGEQPKRQVFHLFNWHYVDPASFQADGGEDWESFLADVEAVQVEQMALLRNLAKSHGLKAVFLEGIAQEEIPGFRKLLGHLARWKKPKVDGPLDEFLIDMHRQDTLMAGELEVLPAEDLEAMEAANPVQGGQVQVDEAANERREDTIVRNVLASELAVAVLILGGDHNLADNLQRIGGGQVEYVRVQVEAHKKAVSE